MFKSCKNFFILLPCFVYFICNQAVSSTSSSYLVANSAVNLLDFEKAYSEYFFINPKNEELGETYLSNRLITTINLSLLSEGNKIAEKILKKDKFNQEAWIVKLTYAKIHNQIGIFKNYREMNSSDMKLLNFIFFDDSGEVNPKNIIAKSIFEIIQASVANEKSSANYQFLLFYLSIANLLEDNFNEANYYTGHIYNILKNYSKAEFYYNKVQISHNLYFESQKKIAIMKAESGFFLEAENNLINLLNIYNNNIDLIIALADLYRINQKYEEAIVYYSKSINLNNDTSLELWRLYYLRGICYERNQNWNTAEEDFLYSLNLNSNSPNVLNYLAYGWLERDINIDQALDMLMKAYNSNPNSYYIIDSLAWAYYKKNELQKALELMEEVIEMVPGEVISLDHLADIYFAMNRKREAIFYWKQALDLAEPEDEIIESLSKKLKKHNAG